MDKLKMIKEFKDFAFKGNLIDMAVGVIIGGAFGTVMKSLVDDIFMPVLGLITGGIDFSDKYVALNKRDAITDGMTLEQAEKTGAALLTYGNFISSFIAFLLIALAVFLVIVKVIGFLTKEEEEPKEEKEPEPSDEVKLLTEIRDALKK